MRKIYFFVVLALFMAFGNSCRDSLAQKKNSNYKDGIFEGVSRSRYTDEPYYAKVKLTITNGQIADVKFSIRDSSLHEFFDEKYEKHFSGNEEYVNQCRNDWKGVKSYPDSLLRIQNIEKVDAISGATWACNMFKAATKEALKKAAK
jgi:major membrane immunogen (membrane-anchored lipoprotein)